jgi:hypothetical protein
MAAKKGALAKVQPTSAEKYRGLEMAISPNEARIRLQELQAFVKGVMRQGEDYGTIPGTQKPTLYKPGAEKLAEVYGLGWRFEDVEIVQDWEKGFFFYRKKCVLFSRRDGMVICEGVGSCNSREDKYAWRWYFENELPTGIDKKSLHSERKNSKKTGKPYTRYRMPNPDVYSLVNTIEKMAAKRALVDAVKGATRSSDLFTQDIEDLPEEAFGERETSRTWETKGETVYADPVPVIAEIRKATSNQALNAIANKNRGLTWTDNDRESIKEAIDARRAALRAEARSASDSSPEPHSRPMRDMGDDSYEEPPEGYR